MQPRIHWKNRLFSRSYTLHSNGRWVGKLRDKPFSQISTGELNDKQYKFITSGFCKQHTSIIDTTENRNVGEISYSNWMTKATLSLNKKTYYWKYNNFMNTKWSIFNAEGIRINFSGTSVSGQIETNTDDPLLLLCGLYVKNYYLQMAIIAIIAVFIPIWVTAIN